MELETLRNFKISEVAILSTQLTYRVRPPDKNLLGDILFWWFSALRMIEVYLLDRLILHHEVRLNILIASNILVTSSMLGKGWVRDLIFTAQRRYSMCR